MKQHFRFPISSRKLHQHPLHHVKMPAFILAALLSLLLQTGIAQPCAFTVTAGSTTPCVFSFTSHVTGVDGYLLEHLWAFGEGSTSDVANPVLSYPSFAFSGPVQNYTVTHTLTVRDPFTLLQIPGSPFVCSQTVTVASSNMCQLCPPTGEGAPPLFTTQVVGCGVKIQANLPNFYTYNWSYGDGVIQNNGPQNVSHLYSGDGVYSIGLGATYGTTSYRCTRTVKVDCTRPNSDFKWTTGGNGCGCFNLDVVPVEQSAGATYGWYVNGQLVATGLHPNLFPHGIDICAVQQNGGNIEVSLVVQLDGESSPITKKIISLSGITPGIYIGFTGGTTNLSEYESVLPGSSYCGTCKVKVCGIITVNKSFEFCGSEVEVSPGNCGFDVNQDRTLSLTGGARMHGCQCIWRGIRMLPQSIIAVSGSSIIEDAAYAIDVQDNTGLNPVQLSLNTGIFRNNYIGVRITGRANFAAFTHNLFTTLATPTPPLWADCLNILPQIFTRDIGFAGMFIDHLTTTLNLPNDNNQNIFRNLAIGIHSQNGTLTLDHTATFNQINTCTAYQNNHGGAGVFFQNDASFTATGNIFTAVKTGIWGETNVHTDLSITANVMNTGTPSVARGIQLVANQPGDMDGLISSNAILVNNPIACLSNSDAFAVSFFDNTNLANALTITQNPITLNSTINETHGILLIANTSNANTPVNIEVNVDDNTITGQNSSTAIQLRGIRRAAVHGNTINLSGSNGIIGIQVGFAENNLICFNTITNTSGNNRGFWVNDSRFNDIVNNIMNSTTIGALFSGDCGDSFIGCNQFNGTQQTGLQYTGTNTRTGVQDNTGNTWNGTFSVARALISLPNSFFSDNIYIVPVGPSPFNPGNTQQQGGAFWFDDTQFSSDPDCSSPTYGCMGFNRPAIRNGNSVDRTNSSVALSASQRIVFPNPADQSLTVSFPVIKSETGIALRDITGRTVLQQQFAAGTETALLSTASFVPGIYFLEVTQMDQVTTRSKIMIIHK